MNPQEEAKKMIERYGKEKALELINLSISEMIRSCSIKRHTKLVRQYILTTNPD